MNRILIVTGSTVDMYPVLDLTLNTKSNYASKHHYDFIVKRSWQGVAKYHFKQYENCLLGYHQPILGILGFLRVSLCFEYLRDYDAVMWIDGDSVITNSDIKIEDIIDKEGCFFASYDWAVGVNTFSTGNFIVKRHSSTQRVYEQFIETSKKFIGNVLQEQITLNTMYKTFPELQPFFKIVPRKFLNSVPKIQETTGTWKGRPVIEEPWSPGCFLAHLTGLTSEERIKILTNEVLIYT